MSLTLDQLLARVVERKGFAVQGADAEALLARKGEEGMLVAWKTDGPLTADDARMFATAMEQVKAMTGILVATRGADAAAKEPLGANVEVWSESRLVTEVGEAFVHDAVAPAAHAPAPAVGPSGPSKFPSTNSMASAAPPAAPAKRNVHESLIAKGAHAAGSTHNPGAAMFMPSKPRREAPLDMRANIPQQKGGALGYAWGGATGGASNPGIAMVRSGRNPKNPLHNGMTATDASRPGSAPTRVAGDDVEIISTPKRAAPSSAAQAAAPPASLIPPQREEEAYEIMDGAAKKAPTGAPAAMVAPVNDGTPKFLKLATTKEQALQAAQQKSGSPVSARLALVPHVCFTFDVHMERQNLPTPVTGSGALLVSSLTGDLHQVDALDFTPAAPPEARREEPKLQAVDVYDKIKSHMSKAFTRTMSVEREVAGNSIMENLKLTPDPEEMGLQHCGIVFVPIWEVQGATGSAKVDGSTGQLIA